MNGKRLTRLCTLLQAGRLDALALTPGPSLKYLTGLHFHLMERPILALFTAEGRAAIVLPDLEKSSLTDIPLEVFSYSETPAEWSEAFRRAVRSLGLSGKCVGVEPRAMRLLEFRYLEQAASAAAFPDASAIIAELRLCKEAEEIAAMRRAVAIAQAALWSTLPLVRPGVSERDLAAELLTQLLRHGSQPTLPFAPIVSAGPNAANPHAAPSDRPLQPGDLLVIDWGASADGYISDLTRTFAIGAPGKEEVCMYEAVRAAGDAARAVLQPGVTCAQVDRVARQVIEQAGYGRYFVHRTGHGIGLEAHEPPYLHAENSQALEVGMTFTIEPGVYLPGRNGVRIEDNLVVTEEGAECLSDWPRSLQVIG